MWIKCNDGGGCDLAPLHNVGDAVARRRPHHVTFLSLYYHRYARGGGSGGGGGARASSWHVSALLMGCASRKRFW